MQMSVGKINGMRINKQLDHAIQIEGLEALALGLLDLAVLYQVLNDRDPICFEFGQRVLAT
jgi:hypothetical protein